MFRTKQISNGFTLIELIIVIVITGIVAGILYPVIMYGMKSSKQFNEAKELSLRARLAIERISRDLRYAIPNSIRVHSVNSTNDSIEFGDSIFQSHYSTIDGTSSPYTLNDDTGLTIPTANYISIYNTNADNFYSYPNSTSVFDVTSISGSQIQFNANQKPYSPNHRYSLFNTCVCYSLDTNGILYRYSGYNPSQDFQTDASDKNILIDNVQGVEFKYYPGNLSNAALVSITLIVKIGDSQLTYHQEVHIRNVP
ncbi:MSHA biogenesis protein MshO [Thermotomaculum hydrothermale]|uniref:MSHA biogenesis protein MshO n=1 Tax=Thermotomaculum hydrothermale TaxID=981385 RepID=A0A7R6PUE9_9BACT|nr:prepilin-type N-terminal cleavage/methylation domain-containing protein [Thermotomaculum hydrothermale]BBB32862.1 MSHA biogenesis protein MshO [Thermotomaculum hydrothermale]